MILVLVLGLGVAIAGGLIPANANQQAFATGGYQRGYADAVCDSNNCHEHGYDPSCPSGHSSDYCSNYDAGYSAGWNNNGNVRTVSSQSEGAAIGGNTIRGSHNIVNQQIIQQQNTHGGHRHFTSDNTDSNNNDGSSGQCKAFCLGVQ